MSPTSMQKASSHPRHLDPDPSLRVHPKLVKSFFEADNMQSN